MGELRKTECINCGISFDPISNKGRKFESRREPMGTNLFCADQAEAMVRYMIEGMPVALIASAQGKDGGFAAKFLACRLPGRDGGHGGWRISGANSINALARELDPTHQAQAPSLATGRENTQDPPDTWHEMAWPARLLNL